MVAYKLKIAENSHIQPVLHTLLKKSFSASAIGHPLPSIQ